MGIRVEYGSRKATNGPMIFFTDPFSEQNLASEIQAAAESRLSFYAYRMPGDHIISFGMSESVVKGIGVSGFVIAPFDPGLPSLTIPYQETRLPEDGENINKAYNGDANLRTTDFSEYSREISAIKMALSSSGGGKIVAARICAENRTVDVGATFISLSRAYPNAYIYCFSTPMTGCWVGASPELLLSGKNDTMNTMALAGTRKAGIVSKWDDKNIEEQRLVAKYIEDIFTKSGLEYRIEDTFTRNAGEIEHLCTPIIAIRPESFDIDDLKTLLNKLSPTPALSGFPREMALNVIRHHEHFDRFLYGGFTGPFRTTDDFTFYVTIRCARILARQCILYTGGGITLKSNDEDEWEETRLKAETLNKFIVSQ